MQVLVRGTWSFHLFSHNTDASLLFSRVTIIIGYYSIGHSIGYYSIGYSVGYYSIGCGTESAKMRHVSFKGLLNQIFSVLLTGTQMFFTYSSSVSKQIRFCLITNILLYLRYTN